MTPFHVNAGIHSTGPSWLALLKPVEITAKASIANHPHPSAIRGFARNEKLPLWERIAVMLYLGEIKAALRITDKSSPDKLVAIERTLAKYKRENSPGYKVEGVFAVLRKFDYLAAPKDLKLAAVKLRVKQLIRGYFTHGLRQDV